MSADLLQFLRDAYVFDATPSFHDLGVYHVPFDELVGGKTVEARLGRGVLGGERIAVIGGSGSGKSSVISHVLDPTAIGVAPILVPLVAVPPEQLTATATIVDRIIQAALNAARAAHTLGDEAVEEASEAIGTKTRSSHARGITASVGLALSWLSLGRATEIIRQTDTIGDVAIEQKRDAVEAVLAGIARDGLQPVLVFEDTDRWLTGGTRQVVAGFFGGVLRWISDMPAAVVVAVHPTYFRRPLNRRDVLAHLDTHVEIPDLANVGALRRLLGRRVEAHVAGTEHSGATLDDVLDLAALEGLFEYYQQRGTYLRHVVQVAHRALMVATDQGESRVSNWFVRDAIAAG